MSGLLLEGCTFSGWAGLLIFFNWRGWGPLSNDRAPLGHLLSWQSEHTRPGWGLLWEKTHEEYFKPFCKHRGTLSSPLRMWEAAPGSPGLLLGSVFPGLPPWAQGNGWCGEATCFCVCFTEQCVWGGGGPGGGGGEGAASVTKCFKDRQGTEGQGADTSLLPSWSGSHLQHWSLCCFRLFCESPQTPLPSLLLLRTSPSSTGFFSFSFYIQYVGINSFIVRELDSQTYKMKHRSVFIFSDKADIIYSFHISILSIFQASGASVWALIVYSKLSLCRPLVREFEVAGGWTSCCYWGAAKLRVPAHLASSIALHSAMTIVESRPPKQDLQRKFY